MHRFRASEFLRRLGLFVCLLSVLPVLSGCGGGAGPNRGVVHGKVTLDGNPVEEGMIAFIPTGSTQGPTEGAPIQDGEYQTLPGKGPVAGTNRVEITATRATGVKEVQGVQGSQPGGLSGATTAKTMEMYIPERYNTKSTLEIEVKSGDNLQNFELTTR